MRFLSVSGANARSCPASLDDKRVAQVAGDIARTVVGQDPGSIGAELCRRKEIVQNLYYRWSKEFSGGRKKRLACDTARAVTSEEVKEAAPRGQRCSCP